MLGVGAECRLLEVGMNDILVVLVLSLMLRSMLKALGCFYIRYLPAYQSPPDSTQFPVKAALCLMKS